MQRLLLSILKRTKEGSVPSGQILYGSLIARNGIRQNFSMRNEELGTFVRLH